MENSSDAKEYTHKKFKKTSVTIPPFDSGVVTASTTTTTTTALSTASVTETRTTLTQASVIDGYPSKGTSNDDANKTLAKDFNRNITSPVSTKYAESLTVITNSINDPSSRNDQAASISSICIVDSVPDVKSISNAESSVKETHRQHIFNSQKSFNSILDTDKIIDSNGSLQSNQSSSNISLVNCSLSNDNKLRVESSSSPHHNDGNNRFGTVSTSSQPIKTEIVNYSQTYEPVTSMSSERHPGYPVNISSTIISTQPLIFSYDTSSVYNVRSSELEGKTVDLTVGSVVNVKEEPVEIKKKPAEVTGQGGKYVCSYCNLPCSKPSVLQKHVRAHTNERPYPCTTCGFSFKTKSNLYKHSRSRSHANRVKGDSNSEINKNKTEVPETVEQNVRATTAVRSEPTQYYGTSATSTNAYNIINLSMSSEVNNVVDGHTGVISAHGRKPYKPKFQFFSRLDSGGGDNVDGKEQEDSKQTPVSTKLVLSNESLKKGNDKLTQHINDLIKKNQSILDVREPNFLKKRGHHVDTNENRNYTKNQYDSNVAVDEPLNLIARNRKRCMSESEHTQKSLIKELLLRNLTQEQTYVCQFCKISFKNIENFEIHRKNYCKVGENPTSKDIAFVRSHSVNVASILHKNFSKNDENPSRFVRTNLPLKSPGPYLGKTSLISDKGQIPQVFYENKAPTKIHLKALSISHDNLTKSFDRSNTLQEIINNPLKNNNEIIMKPQNIIISEHDSKKHLHEEYKNVYGSNYSSKTQMPVKLFGGEVKITEMSGETRSYKIESKNVCDFSQNNQPFINYGNNLSENMVIKSSLQSGGTLVQNSPSYDKNSFSSYTPKFEANNSPSFQFFNSPSVSKNSASEHDTSRRNYQGEMTRKETPTRFDFNVKPQEGMYDQNLIDLGQKAAKSFAPNLKQPNLTLPGLPIPSYNSPKKHYSDHLDQASPSWSLNSPLFSPSYMKLRQDLTPSTPDVFSPKPDRTKPNFPDVTSKPLPTVEVTPPSGRPNNIVLSQPSPVGVAAPQSTFNMHGLRLYNPLNLLVNGKLVRYVPGMPGPETGNPIHIGIGGPVLPSPLQIGKTADANEAINFSPKVMKTSPVPRENKFNFNIRPENDVANGESPKRLTPTYMRHPNNLSSVNNSSVKINDKSRMLSPKKFENEPLNFVQSRSPLQHENVEIKTESVIKNFEPTPPRKSLKNVRIYNENSTKTVRNIENVDQISENKAASKIPENDTKEIPKIELDASRKGVEDEKKPMKFLRPNTLAIRPNSSVKTLHGLTPSFLTQDLISPDTPRFAKKYCQLYINGSYFTNLKLKTSTRQTYCTLDMPQPIYWPSYANLSMYTHYKNKRSATDVPDLFRHCYDSRQRSSRYTVAKMTEMITVESSYKSMMETMQKKEETNKCIATTSLPGGYYESNDDYTYIRGRGRGRYVCDQCGIRCKKPSMLKKHIRTHSDVRPYTCLQCNFSFKTKGNLTKHMKSKSHYKRTSTSSSPASDTHTPPRSSTTTDDESDSDVDSDDSIRLQEHEAAHSLLSLAQSRSSQESNPDSSDMASDITIINENKPESSRSDVTMSTSTRVSSSENPSLLTNGNLTDPPTPLMYPYIKQTNPTSDNQDPKMETLKSILYYNKIILRVKEFDISKCKPITPIDAATPTKIQFLNDQIENPDLFIANYQQKFISQNEEIASPSVGVIINEINVPENFVPFADFAHKRKLSFEYSENEPEPKRKMSVVELPDISKLENGNIRKRHVSVDIPNHFSEENFTHKRKISLDVPVNCTEKIQRTHRSSVPSNIQGNAFENFSRAMDLSVSKEYVENRNASARNEDSAILDLTKKDTGSFSATPVITISMNSGHGAQQVISSDQESAKFINEQRTEFGNDLKLSIKRKLLNYNKTVQNSQSVSESVPCAIEKNVEEPKVDSAVELNRIDKINPNETRSDSDSNMSERSVSVNNNLSKLQNAENDVAADTPLKREIIEKNKLAQSVASEYLKLVSKNDSQSDSSVGSNGSADAVVKSDSIFNSEENKSCTICFKNFNKPSQLRLHTQIHYFAERKFRCDSCSVSFRTKGHLQKHERSASHHNKLSSTPTTSSSEPRPFKCSDCNIAFRIHGHLAKHLRSKMHIMKLECLARVPFGLYAELERANSLLTEINTTDCDLCLESLKVLARKLFSNDPNKLIQLENPLSNNLNQDSQEHAVAVQDN